MSNSYYLKKVTCATSHHSNYSMCLKCLSAALYAVWFHCCKWPNCDLCILPGSV